MKKFAILFVLFILPIVAYLFFASGINSFGKLPTITKTIKNIDGFATLNESKVTLDNKITILAFAGTDMIKNQGNFYNFTEQIYDKNKDFKDFQVVVIAPNESKNDAIELKKRLSQLTDMKGWNFIFGTNAAIEDYFKNLKLKGKLNANLGSNFFYIIDKKRNLRGRNDDKDYKEGYNTFSPSDLHNEMMDDVKIILAEYRFALKRNNNKRKI